MPEPGYVTQTDMMDRPSYWLRPVSYTHLDVYKRQGQAFSKEHGQGRRRKLPGFYLPNRHKALMQTALLAIFNIAHKVLFLRSIPSPREIAQITISKLITSENVVASPDGAPLHPHRLNANDATSTYALLRFNPSQSKFHAQP